VGRWLGGISLTVDYLCQFWDQPCYDWWEEHAEHRHGSTLGAIFAGLMASASSGALDRARQDRARHVASEIKEGLLTKGLAHGGHLAKWEGSQAIDASLAACVVPFGVVEPGHPVAEATLAKIEADLCVDGGVHRYTDDVFFGGGQWPLLTCLLGWNHAVAGRRDRAIELLSWATRQADAAGCLPEQVDDHLLWPAKRAEWVDKWGPVAKPLLWSHAMVMILAHSLGLVTP